MATLEQRINLLQRQLSVRRATATDNVVPVATAVQRSAAPVEAELDVPVEVSPDQQLANIEEQRASWELRFNNDGNENNLWANEKTESLRTALDATALGKVRSVHCRGTTCRIETQHESKADAEALLDENAVSSALLGTTYYRFPLDETKTHFVMYVEPARPRPPIGATARRY